MSYDVVVEFINGVGFPIAVCVALYYQNSNQDDRYDKQMQELRKVIENNTMTLTDLCGRLERGMNYGENR